MRHKGISHVSDQALASCRQVMTDERLEYMGDRYRRLAIGFWTGVSFYSYLLHPEALEAEAARKRRYAALKVNHQGRVIVATTVN